MNEQEPHIEGCPCNDCRLKYPAICTCNLPNGKINPAFDCVLHEVIHKYNMHLFAPKKDDEVMMDDEKSWRKRWGFSNHFSEHYTYRRLRPTSEIKLGKTGIAGQTDLPEQPLDCPTTQVIEDTKGLVSNIMNDLLHEQGQLISNLERERDEAKNSLQQKLAQNAIIYGKERDELEALLTMQMEEWKSNAAAATLSVLEARDLLDPNGNLSFKEAAIKIQQSLAASQAQVAELVKAFERLRKGINGECGTSATTHYLSGLINQALALTPSKAFEKYQRMEKALSKIMTLYPSGHRCHDIAKEALNND
jgi:hypothetical protein